MAPQGAGTPLHITSRVWLKISNLKWVPGTVQSVNDREMLIRTDDGQSVSVPRGSDRVSQRTPPGMEAVDNLTTLPDLDEPNMLHSLCVRYTQRKIYTRTGPILVAMNPWQDLRLYGAEVLQMFRNRDMDSTPPHVFAIAEAAFKNLQTARRDQTILVSGDSGSGKTESTKFMMQYLAAVAHHTAVTANTEQQVLQCNPVLEAFGNAKTLRNDNSSRFGKYIDIHFDDKHALIGAKIDTYLLEKSRVVMQEEGERSYHIFYQLASQAGTDSQLTRNLQLRPAEHFKYIQRGANVGVAHRPATSLQNTLVALQAIGINDAERDEIFRVLSAILHLGNVNFGSDKDGGASLAAVDPVATTVARMLGCDASKLVDSFLLRSIQAGAIVGGDAYTVSQSVQQAFDSRDAFARALYGSLFDLLVVRINARLGQMVPGGKRETRRISILDIFGFEHFKTNHFEQFCINYANEKLQGHFNEYNFTLEIAEYQRESIEWSYADFQFQTNTKCIEMIEDKRTGMLALLDETIIMPSGDDDTYCTKLKQEIPDNQFLYTKKMKGTLFTVKHYAAEVVYDASGFCFKNRDPVQPTIVEIMTASTSAYVRDMFKGHVAQLSGAPSSSTVRPGRTPKNSTIIFESVTAQFKRQLADLMTRINAAQPHFVRCINPNSRKEANKLEPEMILDQLRCSGLMEAVRVSRAGFPVRMVHADFIHRFSILIPPPPGEPKTVAKQMCVSLRVPAEHYRIGTTKVFMRREIHEKLEEERSRLLVRQAVSIQKAVRGHLARNLMRRLRLQRKTGAIGIQRQVRRLLVRRWYADMLEKRARMIAGAQGASARPPATPGAPGAPGPLPGVEKQLENAHSAQRSAVTSTPRPPGRPGAPSESASGPLGRHDWGVQGDNHSQIVQELGMQLDSVRELYYNERASQMALSNLVREVQELRDPRDIDRRIRAIQEKIRSARSEGAANQSTDASDYEDGALARRTDSLTAALGLLQDKLNLINAAGGTPRVDLNKIRGDVQRELAASHEADLAARVRTVSEAVRLESRETIRRKDAEIASLQAQVQQLRGVMQEQEEQSGEMRSMHEQQLLERLRVRDHEVETLEHVKGKMMADRAVLEQIIRSERKQREDEFNDMDANVRARDERIQELSELLEAQQQRISGVSASHSSEIQRRLAAKDTDLQAKVAKIEELQTRLAMAEAKGLINGDVNSVKNSGLQQGYAELSEVNEKLRQQNAELHAQLVAQQHSGGGGGGGGRGGGVQADEADCERMEVVARLMSGIAEIDDLNTVRDKAATLMQQKIFEVNQEHRKASSEADAHKELLLSSQRRMFEAFRVILLRL